MDTLRTPSDRLQAKLEAMLPGIPVYFRPPTGYKMTFPCVVFDLKRNNPLNADNKPYVVWHEFRVQYFTRDPRDENIYILENAEYTRFEQSEQTNGINRFVYDMNII